MSLHSLQVFARMCGYRSFIGSIVSKRRPDDINKPHEDYPDRIPATIKAIHDLQDGTDRIRGNQVYQHIQASIFPDHGDEAGKWRTSNVSVGTHVAPKWEMVPDLMDELLQRYISIPLTIGVLQHWYADFETIHPFRDGNGRVGGVILAYFSNTILGDGYIAPGQ